MSEPVLQVALEESRRAIDAQEAAIESFRTRAMALLGAVAIAAAAVKLPDSDVVRGLAALQALAVLASLIYIMWPKTTHRAMRAAMLLEDQGWRSLHGAGFTEEVVRRHTETFENQATIIKRVGCAYSCSVILMATLTLTFVLAGE